jgi:hypothetical protein
MTKPLSNFILTQNKTDFDRFWASSSLPIEKYRHEQPQAELLVSRRGRLRKR